MRVISICLCAYQLDDYSTAQRRMRKKIKVGTISIAWLLTDVHTNTRIQTIMLIRVHSFIPYFKQNQYFCDVGAITIGMSSDIELIIQYNWNCRMIYWVFLSMKQLICHIRYELGMKTKIKKVMQNMHLPYSEHRVISI